MRAYFIHFNVKKSIKKQVKKSIKFIFHKAKEHTYVPLIIIPSTTTIIKKFKNSFDEFTVAALRLNNLFIYAIIQNQVQTN